MNCCIVPNLVNLWRFRKIRCKLSEIWEPKFANIYKEMYAGGGGNRLLFKLLWKSIKQAHNYFKSIQ